MIGAILKNEVNSGVLTASKCWHYGTARTFKRHGNKFELACSLAIGACVKRRRFDPTEVTEVLLDYRGRVTARDTTATSKKEGRVGHSLYNGHVVTDEKNGTAFI